MRAAHLGLLLGAVESGMTPAALSFCHGQNQKLARDTTGKIGRVLVREAHAVMQATKFANSAPSFHLKFVADSKDWTSHHQEVADDVTRVFALLRPMKKKAFMPDAVAGAGLAARGLAGASLGTGAGLGALYWLLSRHSNQDSADLESMQHQIDYYNDLGKELDHSMRRKHRYTDIPQ